MIYEGITTQEANRLRETYGLNEIESEKKISILSLLIESFKEPMLIILFVACFLYLIIGDTTDFLVLTASALIILTINISQSYRTSKAIEKLKNLSKKYSEVFRNGKKEIIETKYLVPSDYILVSEGDRVPADVLIIDQGNLTIDESILTGESLPVQKINSKENFEGKENSKFFAYSGTLVSSGWLVGIVRNTANKTKIGILGKSLKKIPEQEPQVKKEISEIVGKLAILCIITCLFIWTWNIAVTKDIISSTIYTVSLAVALVPEELPIVLTVFLALSSTRLSRKNLIIKNKAIVETLGATNVICCDKTGTLTKNELKAKKLIISGQEYEISKLELNDETKAIIKAAFLATYFSSKDVIDSEISELFSKTDIDVKSYKPSNEGLISKKFVYSKSYEYKGGEAIFVKGAYEQISPFCRIPEKYEDSYLQKIHNLTNQGYRVIAVAEKITFKSDKNKKFKFLGLIAFQDEIREDSQEYVKECQENQIRICMITGDHKNTAKFVAEKVGIINFENVLIGDEIDKLDQNQLIEKVKVVNIYARITPEQKLKIIKALMNLKNIVAMTGDGVNDALALKTANVGLAIGKGGTDIARETSDVILLENNLKNIIEGIIEGRRIYENLAITARYILSFHIPIVLLSISVALFQLPVLLLPIHIAILEFIIDPFSTIVFESIPAQKNILALKPRKGKFKLIENMNLKLGSIYGIIIFLLVFLPYYYLNSPNIFTQEIQEKYRAESIAFFIFLSLNIWLIIFNYASKINLIEIFKSKILILSTLILGLSISIFYLFRSNLEFLRINYTFNQQDLILVLASNLTFIILALILRFFYYKKDESYYKNESHFSQTNEGEVKYTKDKPNNEINF